VIIISEGVGNCLYKGMALSGACFRGIGSEVHGEFRVKYEAKVFNLYYFLYGVGAGVGSWKGCIYVENRHAWDRLVYSSSVILCFGCFKKGHHFCLVSINLHSVLDTPLLTCM